MTNTVRDNVALLDSTWGINTTCVLINGQGNRKHLLITGNLLSSCLSLFSRVTTSSCQLLSVVSSFLQSVQGIQHDCLPGFTWKFLHQFPSTITFLTIRIFNQNRPTNYIHQNLLCSHLAAVCNGATVSMETTQVVLDQYQTFHT